jgi:uncharacterized protein DUF6008
MAMGGPVSWWDTIGAVLLLLWAVGMWAAVAVLKYSNRGAGRPWVYPATMGLIVLGVIGQIGHAQEHVAQVVYWALHPTAQPWMTPWGTGLAKGFEQADPGKATFGMEFLHLTGNFIFLAGLAGVMVITRRATDCKARKWGRMGVWMQGIHGLEHLSLTVSVLVGAPRAIGLSTWFGLIAPSPALWTYRIWWHFLANVIGTMIFAIALYHLWQERERIKATYRPRVDTPDTTAPAPEKPRAAATV